MFRPLIALLAATPFATANLNLEPEKRSPLIDMPGSAGILLGGGAESDRSGSDFSWEQYFVKSPFGPGYEVSDELRILFSINYSLTRIDQGDFPTREVLGDLHSIAFPISAIYQKKNSPWSFFAQIAGELSSDLNDITSDDFDFTATLSAQYQFSDSFSLNFGAIRTQNFGGGRILPGLGFTWTPRDDWGFTIIGPRITLSHRLNDRLIIRGGGFPTGGLWNVEEESGESVDYSFTSYNAGVGLDYKLRHGVWLSLWGGMNFVNELRADQGDRTLFEDELDRGFFGSISINIYEW